MAGKATIFVSYSFVGFHAWPDAPQEVRYLASPHRHSFKVCVEIGVAHDDRDREFHMVQREIGAAIRALYPTDAAGEVTLGSRSCEMIAADLLARLQAQAVSVWEDGENGARVEA